MPYNQKENVEATEGQEGHEGSIAITSRKCHGQNQGGKGEK